MTDFVEWGIIISGTFICGGILFYLANQRSCLDDEIVTKTTFISIGIGITILLMTIGTQLKFL